jgi:hypothetical protein
MGYTLIVHIEAAYAITGRNPYMMLVIFDNRANDLIDETILTGEYLIALSWTMQYEPCICSHPLPTTAIAKNAVYLIG